MFVKNQLVYKIMSGQPQSFKVEAVAGEYVLVQDNKWYFTKDLANSEKEAWFKFQEETKAELKQMEQAFLEVECKKKALERHLKQAKFALEKKSYRWLKEQNLTVDWGNKATIIHARKGEVFEAVLECFAPKQFLLTFADGTYCEVSPKGLEESLEEV